MQSIEAAFCREGQPFNWLSAYVYDVPGDSAESGCRFDNFGNALIQYTAYRMYWRVVGSPGIAGDVYIPLLTFGATYQTN
jgi:hypothetical protein